MIKELINIHKISCKNVSIHQKLLHTKDDKYMFKKMILKLKHLWVKYKIILKQKKKFTSRKIACNNGINILFVL